MENIKIMYAKGNNKEIKKVISKVYKEAETVFVEEFNMSVISKAYYFLNKKQVLNMMYIADEIFYLDFDDEWYKLNDCENEIKVVFKVSKTIDEKNENNKKQEKQEYGEPAFIFDL